MEVLAIDRAHPDARIVRRAVQHLAAGGLVVYPTETAYALGADATNFAAVKTIFAVKERSAKKTVPLIVASLVMARTFASFSPRALQLARTYWPGPLTLVLPKSGKRLAASVCSRGAIALRVSSEPIARLLAAKLGNPIVSTSANRSGRGARYSARVVQKEFSKSRYPMLVLDAGRIPRRKPSTIVRVGRTITMLRQGSVKISL